MTSIRNTRRRPKWQPLRLTPAGKRLIWVISIIALIGFYFLGRSVNAQTTQTNEVLDEYFQNAVVGDWPTTGADFFTGIHAGSDVTSIHHAGNYTYVLFRDHPKIDKATGEKIPYSCTNGGITIVAGQEDEVTVAIKHWHQSRHHENDHLEMVIQCPAKDAKALKSAIRWGRDLTLQYQSFSRDAGS